ncbi:MAG TPA: hypothetical protein VFJ74_12575 [Gemmatimonadaceae bacterium]|nr:hypothetical protein [Gemmatimonadaceae bacterium]
MPHHVPRRPPRRPSGGERVFTDDAGRLWSAAPYRSGPEGPGGAAVVFACISDARQRTRAIAIDPALRLADAGDEVLRSWLREAPPMGRLS